MCLEKDAHLEKLLWHQVVNYVHNVCLLAYGLIFIFQKRLAGKSESINKKSFFLAHSFSLSIAHLMQLTILSHSHPSIVFHNSYSYSDSRVFIIKTIPLSLYPLKPLSKALYKCQHTSYLSLYSWIQMEKTHNHADTSHFKFMTTKLK